MTAIIIIAAVLAFFALLILLPVRVRLKYEDDFSVRIYYAFVKVFDTAKQKPPEHKKNKDTAEEAKQEKKEEQKKQLFIVRDWENMDKKEFIRFYAAVLKDALVKILGFTKRLRFKLLSVTVGVGSYDASDTAVQYGEVCTALYPAFSLLETYTKIKTRRINVYPDFVTCGYSFAADVNVSVCLIYLLVFGLKIYKFYKALDEGTYKPSQSAEEKHEQNKNGNKDKESVKTDE